MLSNGDGTLSPGTVRNENERAAVCFVRLGDLLQWAGNVGCGNCKGHDELITVRPACFLAVGAKGQHWRSRYGTAADGGRLYICAVVAGGGDAVPREFRADVSGGEFFIGPDPGQGHGTPMTLSGSTLQGTIGTLAPGSYTVGVRAQDRAGNWSSVSTGTLVVQKARGKKPKG